MLLSKLWYHYKIHCYTHILVMVQLDGISSQAKLKSFELWVLSQEFWASKENTYALLTFPHYLSHFNLLFSLLEVLKVDAMVTCQILKLLTQASTYDGAFLWIQLTTYHFRKESSIIDVSVGS